MENKHVLIYSDVNLMERAKDGVGLLIHKNLSNWVTDWAYIFDKLSTIKLLFLNTKKNAPNYSILFERERKDNQNRLFL